MAKIKEFITSCTLTFKTFGFDVQISQSKAKIWHFVASKNTIEKKYAVYCVQDLKKIKSLVKIALKKLPANTKLVIVALSHDEEDLQTSYDHDYTLLTLSVLMKFGEEMLNIRETESQISKDISKSSMNDDLPAETLIDEIFSKEKIF